MDKKRFRAPESHRRNSPLQKPESRHRADPISRNGLRPSRPGDGHSAERRRDQEHGADEGELAQLDSDVEGEERQRDLRPGLASSVSHQILDICCKL